MTSLLISTKRSSTLILLCVCSLLTSCINQPTQNNGQQVVNMVFHHDSQLPVTLKLPITWKVEQDEAKQAIHIINNNNQIDKAKIEAKKVKVNKITIKLLKAFGRIHVTSRLKEGWVQQRYTENILFDGNSAIQYILRKDSNAEIVYFTGKDQHIYIITVNSSTANISVVNDEIAGGIRFISQPGGTAGTAVTNPTNTSKEPTKKPPKQLPQYSASPNIIGMVLTKFDEARKAYDKDISNALPLSQKTKLLEQICFKHAFLKSESLLQVYDSGLDAILKDAHNLYRKNPGIPDLARADALQSYINNDFSHATEKFENILSKDPSDIHAKLYLAMIRPYEHTFVQSSVEEALQQHPDNILAIYLQSLSYLSENKKRASYDSLKQALNKHPNHLWLNYAVARNYDNEGNTKEAKKLFSKTLELHPSFMAARYNLSLILYKEKKYTQAQKHLSQLITKKNDNTDAILLQGLIHRNQGNNRAAKQMFETVLAIDPDNYRTLYNLGALCATKLNENQCARQAFSRYLSIAPEDNRQSSIINWLNKN